MKKVLLTGANGFIGKFCIEKLLEKEYEVHAVDNNFKQCENQKNLFWYKVDLLNHKDVDDIVKRIKPGYLLHMAWYVNNEGYNDKVQYQWIKAGIDLIDTFYTYGGNRLVVTGTCAEYDWNYSYLREDSTPLRSTSAYGSSKHALHILTDQYCKENNLSYSWPHIFFVYGPGEKLNRLVPYVINSVTEGKDVYTTNGEKLRDYLFVEDVAQALVWILDSDVQGAINVCSGKPIRIKEMVNYLAKKLDGEHLIHHGTKQSSRIDPFCLIGDNTRLTNEVGWKQTVTLEKGLDKIIDSIKTNR